MRKGVSYLLTLCIVLSLGVTSFAESDPAALNPGDIIEFGSYEQDNITGNGPEPIEWQVLDVEGDEAFLVSVHSLDVMKFNETMRSSAKKTLTWAESDIRVWLNQEFFDKAFSLEEKNCLVHASNVYGEETEDYVFLLNRDELISFFPNRSEQVCEPTEYAYAKEGSRDQMLSLNPALDKKFYPSAYYICEFNSTQKRVYVVTANGLTESMETQLQFIRPAMRIRMSILPDIEIETSSLLQREEERELLKPSDFLTDMAFGINKRLLSVDDIQNYPTFTQRAQYYKMLVGFEIDALSKYDDITFDEITFDQFAHAYLDACKIQLNAADFHDMKNMERMWEASERTRSRLIVKAYEKYGLDIREEDYLNYKSVLSDDNSTSGGTGNGPSYEFLEGYWSSRNGMHTFEMKKDHGYITTVPVVPRSGDTYDLIDGVLYKYFASNPGNKTANLKFTKVSDTEIEVYSYQTKTTYTLIKRR